MTPGRASATLARLADLGLSEALPNGCARLTDPDLDRREAAVACVRGQEARRAYERSRREMMRAYAEATACRREFLLNYFGEPSTPPCGNCDVCDAGLATAPPIDAPFPLGMRVRHVELGAGTVQRVEAGRVIVVFDDAGYRLLDSELVEREGLLVAE